jgi:hypothetical protein
VARRRYRSEAISTAGHAAQPRDPLGDESLAQQIEPRQEYGKPPPEPSQPVSNLGEQMRAQRAYAEQQQIAQLHSHIDQMPNLSPAQRQWLHNNPHGLYRFDLLHAGHAIALQRGIPPDSPEYFRELENTLHRYFHLPPQQMQPPQVAPAPAPAPSMPPMPPPVTHVDVSKTENADTGEPEEESVAMHHVSAPVSRGAEHYSGDYEPGSDSRITLSKAEREHAEAAGVSVEEYGRQKLKMLRLKKAKVIKDE